MGCKHKDIDWRSREYEDETTIKMIGNCNDCESKVRGSFTLLDIEELPSVETN